MDENGYPRLLSISIRIRLNYADIHPDISVSYPFTSLIEETLNNVVDFIAKEPKATSAAYNDELTDTSPEASMASNSDLVLRPEHLQLLDVFRQTLRSCKTDAARF